ncbi:MAG: deoxyribonuclease IV [Ardenticatenaceae bacterium]
MPLIGAHCSTAGGVWTAFDRGEEIGCQAIQLFTKSNRRWKARAFKPKEIERFRKRAEESGFPVVAHASYLINLGSPKDEIWNKSLDGYIIEMERCRQLGVPYLVLHPGAHTGSGYDAAIGRIAEGINREHEQGDDSVMLLLEITAGTGTTLGAEMDHFQGIIAQLKQPERLGICFDTCHAVGAGWDIITPEGYASVMSEFEQKIGLDRIRCFHLNDSQYPLGSHRDRHTHIGYGYCTLETFRHVLNDPRFANHPMLLETPKDKDMAQDVVNMNVLRALFNDAPQPVTPENLDTFWEGVKKKEGKDG